MRVLWKLVKVALAAAVVIPLSIIALAIAFGILGSLIGLAFLALKLAALGLFVLVAIRVAGALLCGRSRRAKPSEARQLPAPDPYYEAAVRELDQELGHVPR
jgi:hypothetical protein